MKMKWKSLIVLFALLLATTLQLSVASTAKAWTGALPQCQNFPTKWLAAIKSDSRFTENTSWVAFRRNWYGSPFSGGSALIVVWNQPNDGSENFTNQILLGGNGVDDSILNIPSSSSMYIVHDDVSSGTLGVLDDVSPGGGAVSWGMADLNCVQDTHNVPYSIDWVGSKFPDSVASRETQNASYVAMGDSFSSGEGNPPFESLTDQDGINECHRSEQAYPRLLQNDTSLSLGTTAFVACSGAKTDNVRFGGDLHGGWSEGAQVNALSSATQVVTLTIGGNDVGFSSYVRGCVNFCGEGTGPYNTIMAKINSAGFKADLEATYTDILQDAPNAQLYVADYPYLTAQDATTCGIFDFTGGRAVQDALNTVIQSAVNDVGFSNGHINYVETNYPGSPFEGKHYCNGGDSDFNGFDATNNEYSFHPNAAGQQAYASIFESAMS